jgi:hypothetical protein
MGANSRLLGAFLLSRAAVRSSNALNVRLPLRRESSVGHDTCDICGGARQRSERHRLLWDSGLGIELVLAELCRRCAEQPERLLEIYGRRGHDALRVVPVDAAREAQPRHTLRGIILRGLIYVLVALTAFVVVTTVTSNG